MTLVTRLRKTRFLLVFQVLIVLFIGLISFNVEKAFALSIYKPMGVSYPILREGNALPGGRPYDLIPSLTLRDGEGDPTRTKFRLFATQDTRINFYSPEITWMQNNPRDDYWMVFHAFNYDSNCAHGGVTDAHDSSGNQLNGSWWGTDLPNANPDINSKLFAGCQGQGNNGVYNELRFVVYGNGKTRAITANYLYSLSATFVDYNAPTNPAWVTTTTSFYRHYAPAYGLPNTSKQEADYKDNSNNDKFCVKGNNQVYVNSENPAQNGHCPP